MEKRTHARTHARTRKGRAVRKEKAAVAFWRRHLRTYGAGAVIVPPVPVRKR